jgi:hypothetical protein
MQWILGINWQKIRINGNTGTSNNLGPRGESLGGLYISDQEPERIILLVMALGH